MATIAQITAAANALESAETLLAGLRDARNRAQNQIDTLSPQIQTARQQVRQAADNLVTLIQQGIET